MINTEKDTTLLRKIVSLLPGENCGKCGFENCGKFAVALTEGKAKPTDCRKSIPNMKELCEILGVEIPAEQDLQPKGQKHSRHLYGHHRHGDRHHGHHGHSKHGGGHHSPYRHDFNYH